MRDIVPAPEVGRVALLAEGVDRNGEQLGDDVVEVGRPPRGGRG